MLRCSNTMKLNRIGSHELRAHTINSSNICCQNVELDPVMFLNKINGYGIYGALCCTIWLNLLWKLIAFGFANIQWLVLQFTSQFKRNNKVDLILIIISIETTLKYCIENMVWRCLAECTFSNTLKSRKVRKSTHKHHQQRLIGAATVITYEHNKVRIVTIANSMVSHWDPFYKSQSKIQHESIAWTFKTLN